jgi:anti-anti-sigma regulatory factor
MASNFGIAIDRNSDGFNLKLAGDFDATSAYELIYAIKKLPEDTVKLYIYTNALKTIHSFGLDIFHKFMRSLNGQSAKIVFTGNNASQLSPGNSRLPS